MLKPEDLLQLKEKNLTESRIEEQLNYFIKGFPYLKIKSSASVAKGIWRLTEEEQDSYIKSWDEYLKGEKRITKFVPASGAASRMFKDLFAFLSASRDTPVTDFEKAFFDGIREFAFYGALNDICRANEGADIPALIAKGRYKEIVENLLERKGLNYGSLPKGLLLFHRYPEGARTAMEEHLSEGAMYAENANHTVAVHFTVSPEHLPLFKELVKEKKAVYEERYGVTYDLSFSTQQADTDTIAVDLANVPLRDAEGRLVFRPGGHGALIQNLNRLDSDVVFIKNIDNVVPDGMKDVTVRFKKALAGVLVTLQEKMFGYVRLIESGDYTHDQIEEMIYFLQDTLCVKNPETKFLEDVELVLYIKKKLMRPLRVCGMVGNVGEPGGGPFLAYNSDDTVSPQILESSQIDMDDPEAKAAFEQGSHFNPVDLVCALKDVNGRKYNLPDYIDKDTGFISEKSKDGCDLKALELPGLWNGSMSDWNTVFIEVPPETFNPVKTVNDLLRPQHQ
ncbi:MAG: DUF4301 family protein [Tannerella sp.]|jgi:hypothetical protein|nr:DUF4301 family protein [Tannerella sp.]